MGNEKRCRGLLELRYCIGIEYLTPPLLSCLSLRNIISPPQPKELIEIIEAINFIGRG